MYVGGCGELRRHVAVDGLALTSRCDPDRLRAQRRRLVAVGPVENRRHRHGQHAVRLRGDAVHVGIRARPDRRMPRRRHTWKRRSHRLGAHTIAEHRPDMRCARGVAVLTKALLAETVEADQDGAMRRRLTGLGPHRRRDEDRRGDGAEACQVTDMHRMKLRQAPPRARRGAGP